MSKEPSSPPRKLRPQLSLGLATSPGRIPIPRNTTSTGEHLVWPMSFFLWHQLLRIQQRAAVDYGAL